jgi:hypothetical protein
MNGSAGLVLEIPIHKTVIPYVGAGAGAGVNGGGGPTEPDCDAKRSCTPFDVDEVAYAYGRVGLGIAFGQHRRYLLAAEVALWSGTHRESHWDEADIRTDTTNSFRAFVPGLAFFSEL